MLEVTFNNIYPSVHNRLPITDLDTAYNSHKTTTDAYQAPPRSIYINALPSPKLLIFTVISHTILP